jgi:hypothetical protein
MLLPPARDPILDPPVISFDLMGLRRPWLQVFAVFVCATFFAWVGRFWSPGPWNLLWMIGVPVCLAFIVNRKISRLFFAVVLIFVSFVSLVVNEMTAHLLVGMCLYD